MTYKEMLQEFDDVNDSYEDVYSLILHNITEQDANKYTLKQLIQRELKKYMVYDSCK